MKSRALTPTAHAILSQVALRPWASYDLAKHMGRNLHYFWPRAESRIYAEVKALHAAGLLKAEKSRVGRRARTTYSITPKGQKALERWLGSPLSSGPMLEFEGLLRMFVAHLGTREDLLNALAQTRADIQPLIDLADVISSEYLSGRAPFQQYVHERVFVFDFLYRYAHLVKDWSERARAEVEQWRDVSPEGKSERALRRMAATLEELPMPRRAAAGHSQRRKRVR